MFHNGKAQKILQLCKKLFFNYVETLPVTEHEKLEILLNLSVNLTGQLIVENILPTHNFIKTVFKKVFEDLRVWEESYLFDHPENLKDKRMEMDHLNKLTRGKIN